jgi:cobalt/nickel transport system permease protein
VLVGLLTVAVLVGGGLSWFASTHPDGLEWSIHRLTGREEVDVQERGVHGWAARVQERTALLPDYGFPAKGRAGEPALEPMGPPRSVSAGAPEEETTAATVGEAAGESARWPAIDAGTSVSGIVGGTIVLILIVLIGCALRIRPARLARRTDGATP